MRKIIVLALLLIVACEPLEQQAPLSCEAVEEEIVEVCVRAAEHTKSSLQISESAVSSLNVYAYQNGLLAAESYAADDELSLELLRNTTYRIYALANCGEVHAPALESDLVSVSLVPSQMVMCFREGLQFTTGSTNSLDLTLTRLFARYTLLLDKNLENCDYQITSVLVKQQASSVKPFAPASVAASTNDGDSASAADLVALKNGQGAVFYVPENCQGVLLPDNHDPWAKIPDSIPAAKRGLCTYLHIEGTWTTSGATADLSLNLMLGADNCTDFNVTRNSSTTITLSISDSGTLKSNWKVDMDNLDDDRILSFPSSSQTVMQEDGWTRIPLTVSPPDMPYTASFSDSGSPVMETKVENGELWVRGVYDGDQRPHRTLTVSSWDGRQSASTEVTLDYNYTAFTQYTSYLPQYPGEYGWFEFTDVSASRPVVIEAAGWTTTLGPAAAQNCEYYEDSYNGIEYYVLHDQNKIFIKPLRAGDGMYFQFTQYKSRVGIYMGSVVNPTLFVGDGIVSESGNRCYDSAGNLWYDSSSLVYLADSHGTKLDLMRFRIPYQLLDYKEKSPVDSDFYSEFMAFYGLPEMQTPSAYGARNVTWIEDGGFPGLSLDGNLATVYCYGTQNYGTSQPTYPLTVSVHMISGDVLTASGTLTGIAAFPSQRYLGSFYNYQLAPGAMRNNSTQIDFTSGGTQYAPSLNGVSWTVNHADGLDYDIPQMAYEGGSSDSYSAAAYMSGHTMSFRKMNQTTFPACGMMGLKGTVTNPHSGKTYTGYYTLSLILYVPFGCHVDPKLYNKITVSYAPFTEFTVADNIGIWSSCFPRGVRAQTEYLLREDYPLWNSANDPSDAIIMLLFQTPYTLDGVTEILSENMSAVRFSFFVGGQTYNELILDHSSNLFFADDSWLSDGSRGYYHLVRQYDLGTFNHGNTYHGLDNYLIEAAYESLEDY